MLLGGGDLGRLGEEANPGLGADTGGTKPAAEDGGVGAYEALAPAGAPAATGVRLRLGYEGDEGYASAGADDGGVWGVVSVGATPDGGGVPFLGLVGSLKAEGGAGERRLVGAGGAERVGGGGAGGNCCAGECSFSSASDGVCETDCPKPDCLTSDERSPCLTTL